MQLFSRSLFLRFLKDYCYGLALGLFGAYLLGWVGLLLFGIWGLWNDIKVIREKKEANKEPKKLNKILRKLGIYKHILIYVIWMIVTALWIYVVISFFLAYDIWSNLENVLREEDKKNSWAVVTQDIMLKMSYIIPFLRKYLTYIESKVIINQMSYYGANIISTAWIICIIRSPKLFQYSQELFVQFINYIKDSRSRASLLLACKILLFLIMGTIFMGGKFLFPENITINLNIFLVMFFWLLAPIVGALGVAIWFYNKRIKTTEG